MSTTETKDRRIKYTIEQDEVVKSVADHNVIVESVAGSGKTTTGLAIAERYPNQRILMLTYNARLRLATRDRAASTGIKNLMPHTFHSFAYNFYRRGCRNDRDLKLMMNDPDGRPIAPIYGRFDILIIDESQDITELYFKLILRVIKDITSGPSKGRSEATTASKPDERHPLRMVLFGDPYQSIYKFKESDSRYACFADELFRPYPDHPWVRKTLRTSHRITRQMANFINQVVLGEHRIDAIKDGAKVRYKICDAYNDVHTEVDFYLDSGSYKPEDIFVLAPSVRSELCAARQLANRLTRKGINVYVPHNDEEHLTAELLENKLVFSTFHQAKGLERPVVIVLGADAAYFTKFAKSEPTDVCPNPFYVAFTRAKEFLSVVHHSKEAYLPFLHIDKLADVCTLTDSVMASDKLSKRRPRGKTITLGVPDLLRHLSSTAISRAVEYFRVSTVEEPSDDMINIPTKIHSTETVESVQEINSKAVAGWYEYHTSGQMTIAGGKVGVDTDPSRPDTVLRIATTYCAKQSGYQYKLRQIQKFDWIPEATLHNCHDRLAGTLPKSAKFEVPVRYTFEPSKAVINTGIESVQLDGTIDCVTHKKHSTVWAIKCTDEIGECQLIELAILSFCYRVGNGDPVKIRTKIINVTTGEVLKIRYSADDIKQMLLYLVEVKELGHTELNDVEFLETAKAHLPHEDC